MDLPNEILSIIISYLSYNDHTNFKLISKFFYNEISSNIYYKKIFHIFNKYLNISIPEYYIKTNILHTGGSNVLQLILNDIDIDSSDLPLNYINFQKLKFLMFRHVNEWYYNYVSTYSYNNSDMLISIFNKKLKLKYDKKMDIYKIQPNFYFGLKIFLKNMKSINLNTDEYNKLNLNDMDLILIDGRNTEKSLKHLLLNNDYTKIEYKNLYDIKNIKNFIFNYLDLSINNYFHVYTYKPFIVKHFNDYLEIC